MFWVVTLRLIPKLGPGRRANAKGNGEINKFHEFAPLEISGTQRYAEESQRTTEKTLEKSIISAKSADSIFTV